MIAFNLLPSPLHPAVVHFPIVLGLLGAVVAVAAAFTRRWQLPAIAAVLLGLGALGSIVAVQTGERDGETAGEGPGVEAVLDQHEEWAERTQAAFVAVALVAAAGLFTTRWPRIARGLGIVTGFGALVVAWCVVQTGHYGGQLVYRHGAGVYAAASPGPGADAPGERDERHGDKDD